jgi:chemotaxis methyl-accepting protein methylase
MVAISEQEFRQFADYIKANYGIHFKDEKRVLVAGRLNQVISSMNMNSLWSICGMSRLIRRGRPLPQCWTRLQQIILFL